MLVFALIAGLALWLLFRIPGVWLGFARLFGIGSEKQQRALIDEHYGTEAGKAIADKHFAEQRRGLSGKTYRVYQGDVLLAGSNNLDEAVAVAEATGGDNVKVWSTDTAKVVWSSDNLVRTPS